MVLFFILLLTTALQASDPLYTLNDACIRRLKTVCLLLDATKLDHDCPNATIVQEYLEKKGKETLQAIADDMALIDVLARLTTSPEKRVFFNDREIALCKKAIEFYLEKRFCPKLLETSPRTSEPAAIQSPTRSRKHMCSCIIL